MLGLSGFWVNVGIILTLLSTLLCVIYGIITWNKSDINEEEEIFEEERWAVEEKEVEEEL